MEARHPDSRQRSLNSFPLTEATPELFVGVGLVARRSGRCPASTPMLALIESSAMRARTRAFKYTHV